MQFNSRFMVVLFILPVLAWARLGEGPGSVEKDRKALKVEQVAKRVAHAKAAAGGSQVIEIAVNGTTIRQFVGADNIIFAVSWRGYNHPDLSTLLGNYHVEYAARLASEPKGRQFQRRPIATSEITVIRGGHQFDLRGVAYINGKLPEGMREADLL